jgi:hypothetical protein
MDGVCTLDRRSIVRRVEDLVARLVENEGKLKMMECCRQRITRKGPVFSFLFSCLSFSLQTLYLISKSSVPYVNIVLCLHSS